MTAPSPADNPWTVDGHIIDSPGHVNVPQAIILLGSSAAAIRDLEARVVAAETALAATQQERDGAVAYVRETLERLAIAASVPAHNPIRAEPVRNYLLVDAIEARLLGRDALALLDVLDQPNPGEDDGQLEDQRRRDESLAYFYGLVPDQPTPDEPTGNQP